MAIATNDLDTKPFVELFEWCKKWTNIKEPTQELSLIAHANATTIMVSNDGKSYWGHTIKPPEEQGIAELVEWCKRWMGIKAHAEIMSMEISIREDEIVTATCKLKVLKKTG